MKQIHHHIINQPTNDNNNNIHKGTNEKQKEPLQISIIYTNQQDFQFTKKQHEINRNLRLSNIISTFASTTIYNENKMHQKNDYFDTIDLINTYKTTATWSYQAYFRSKNTYWYF